MKKNPLMKSFHRDSMMHLENINDFLTPLEMKNVIYLLGLYAEINSKVVQEYPNKSRIFR